MSMTMIAVRRRSTVTFCGAQLIVTGTGGGAAMAISTASFEACHRYCEPTPKRPPDSNGCARFSTADMVILPLLGRPGTGGEGSTILIASSLPAKPVERRPRKSAAKRACHLQGDS